jgi:hypothetical protein
MTWEIAVMAFTSDVEGTPMGISRQAIGAYICQGHPVALGEFCCAEFFISPMDFEWTMLHTHEDHVMGSPYFIRRDWLC